MRETIRNKKKEDTDVKHVQRHLVDFLALTRPRVVVMVLVTTVVGFYLASVGAPDSAFSTRFSAWPSRWAERSR
jgi:heme O synthase-like polyprenyltransferase